MYNLFAQEVVRERIRSIELSFRHRIFRQAANKFSDTSVHTLPAKYCNSLVLLIREYEHGFLFLLKRLRLSSNALRAFLLILGLAVSFFTKNGIGRNAKITQK
jgi:hypothetical protein